MSLQGTGGQLPRSARLLWLSLAAFWCGEALISIRLRPDEVLNPRLWFLPPILGGLYAISGFPYATVVAAIRRPMTWLVALSVVAAVVDPGRVFSPTDYRLHGLFCHANVLSVFLALFILLPSGTDRPSKSDWFWRAVAVGLLLLTQCKTVIALSLVGGGLMAVLQLTSSPERRCWRRVGLLATGFVALAAWVGWGTITSELERRTTYRADKLATLTDRTDLWELVLSEWRNQPYCGYGCFAWKENINQFIVSGQHLPHAHNLCIQARVRRGGVRTGLTSAAFCGGGQR